MANVNVTSDSWTEISITSGTIQNISATADIELSAEQTDNSGVVLKPSELYQWDNETIYARAVTEDTGALRVVNFKKATGGGGSYVLPVASSSTLGGVKVGNNLSIDASGVLSATGGGGAGNPVGTIISFMGTTAPANYLICDGTAYNITDYQTLADHIAAHFGAVDFFGGDGVSTFAVPDLRGEFLRGTGTNGHSGNGSGENVGVHQDSTSVPRVNDNGSSNNQTQIYLNTDLSTNDVINYDTFVLSTGDGKIRQHTGSIITTSGAREYKYTSRPTNTSVLYCIKYQ